MSTTLLPKKRPVQIDLKKAFYVGWNGYGNLGDDALFSCISALFRPDVALVDRSHFWSRYDLAILGGGTLIEETDMYAAKFAGARSRHKVVFGAGVEDPAFPFLKKQGTRNFLERWRRLLNEQADAVFVRGPLSQEILEEAGVSKPVSVIGDPVLSLAEKSRRERKPNGVLGVNLGHSFDRIWGGSDVQFLQRFDDILVSVVKRGWKIRFFPVWTADVALCEAAAARLPAGASEVVPLSSAGAFLELVEDVDIFIGEKLHSVVLAACRAVPILSLEYRPKCADFMASLGLERYAVRTDHVEKTLILELLDEMSARRSILRHQIETRVHELKHLQQKTAEEIKGWLAS